MMIRLALILTTLVLLSGALLGAQATQPADPTSDDERKFTTPSGLTIIKLEPGSGARDGDMVFVHYTGRLTDGTKFDSSHDRNQPIPLQLGSGQVIAGWEEGLRGMLVGEKRQLIIPPKLAYGAEGRGEKIPPNATLVFDVELVGLQR